MPHLTGSVEEPVNREPPSKELISSFTTKQNGFDRNHGPIPHLSGETHRVKVDGEVEHELSLSVTDLKNSFPQHEVVCALQCAGNRRRTMSETLKKTEGLSWGDGAIMNCTWRGPLLKDVLEKAGARAVKDGHAVFACYQVECQEDSYFGGSISLARALDQSMEVVLAVEMNGEELKANHGFPVRIICPGIAGARSVKWLDRISVSQQPSQNFYQQHDYKVLPPEVTSQKEAEPVWDTVPALMDLPINSAIAVPEEGESVQVDEHGKIEVKGYALAHGSDGPITKVEVSSDGGYSWTDAEIVTGGKWAWALWRASVPVTEKGSGKLLLSRATDAGGNTQNEHPVWNLRGVAYDGYGEARFLTFT